MHQTTVRFGADLWEALEAECSALGISAAQFVREAALGRLMYLAGQRGDAELGAAFRAAEHALRGPVAPLAEVVGEARFRPADGG
jgi:hypothetical protein